LVGAEKINGPPVILVLSPAKTAATLGIPFTRKGREHQNEPKTKIIAGRRVSFE
jgi:hypothetical protein